MASEERLDALRQRVTHKQPTKGSVSGKRSRHTLYLDKGLVKLIDQAFKDTAHELYPQEIEKADYLEACLKLALAHPDQVKTMLLSNIEDR
jgi:hypothetical protein